MTPRRRPHHWVAVSIVCASAVGIVTAVALRVANDPRAGPGRGQPSQPSAAASSSAAAEQPALGDVAGLVAFASERDGQREIYVMRPDGSGLERVTSSLAQDYPGPPSPDGRRLLAVTANDAVGAEHREQLALLESGPGGWTSRLIAGPSRRMRSPAWLPDGSGVVVESDSSGFVAIELHWLDGRAPERLTDERSGSFDPAVRPDGKAIAFVSSPDGDAEIYRLDLGTRQLVRLTWSTGDDGSPVWAPDGAHLAYLSQRRGAFRAYLMGGDGAHPRPLLGPNDPVDGGVDGVVDGGRFLAHADLSFSPDGSRVALVERREGRAVLQVVRVADGALLGAADGRWHDQTPCWTQDGRHIVFASDRSGDLDLFVVDADGRGPRQLTRSRGADWLPRWLEAPHRGESDAT